MPLEEGRHPPPWASLSVGVKGSHRHPLPGHKEPNYGGTTGKGIWGKWPGRPSLVLPSCEKEEPHSARAHGQAVSSAPPGIDAPVPKKQTTWKARAGVSPSALWRTLFADGTGAAFRG